MRICRLGEKRIRQGWMCVILTLVMLIAPFTASALPWRRNDEPVVKGYQISATSGQTPVEVRIEITAASAKQMRVETAQGTVLLGAESFSYDGNGDSVFVLQTTFSSAYEGELYIYLKNQEGHWIKADEAFYVNYQGPARPAAPRSNQITVNGLRLHLGQDGGWVVTQCDSNDYFIDIPSVVEGIPVTGIADGAFIHRSALRRIGLPDGLKFIGDNAFFQCSSLQSVTLPEGVESIGQCAFYYCSALEEIKLPASLTSIGRNAIYRAEYIGTGSWERLHEMPTVIYVVRNTYAANYVNAYHSHDEIRYY